MLRVNRLEHLKNVLWHVSLLMHRHSFGVHMHIDVLTVFELPHVEGRFRKIWEIFRESLVVNSHSDDVTHISDELLVLNFQHRYSY